VIGDRWGVSDAEVAQGYPCDSFVSRRPGLKAWRGVTVHASADQVWPWVVQIRLAPYAYDWIDNGGRRSPRHLIPRPDPRPGEHFTTVAGRRRGRVLSVEPGRQLTGSIMGAFMSYVLLPADGSTTRLLLKVVAPYSHVVATTVCLGDLVMARRQLLNLKRLAESRSGGVCSR
jgi:hypothetical protein